jgi:hypothetical protein
MGRAELISHHSEHGKSIDHVRCPCGHENAFYRWSWAGRRRVFIQTLLIDNRRGWFWHHVEHLNTLKEKVACHEIKFCPYCGQELV